MLKIEGAALEVDLAHLDAEAASHAQNMFQIGSDLVEAKSKTKLARANLKLTEADLSVEIRKNPGSYGLEKVTEDGIKATVLSRQDFQKAQQQVFDCEHDEDMLNILFQSWHEKGSQIETLAKLHGQMYWAKPDMKPDTKTTNAVADRKISEALNKGNKKPAKK